MLLKRLNGQPVGGQDKPQNTKVLLFSGLISLVTIICFLTVVSLWIVRGNFQEMGQAVETTQATSQLVNRLHVTNNDLQRVLGGIPLLQDELFVDREWMQVKQLQERFGQDLSSLTPFELSYKEKAIIDKQESLFKQLQPILKQALNKNKTSSLIKNRALPLVERAGTQLAKLVKLHDRAVNDILNEKKRKVQKSISIAFMLMLVGVLTGAVPSILVFRSVALRERKLLSQKDRAEMTLHSIGDGVITINKSNRIVQMNGAAELLTGWGMAEAINQSHKEIFRVIKEADRTPIKDPIEIAQAERRAVKSHGEDLLIRREGEEYAIEHSVAPIFDLQEQVTGAIIVFRNVTETRDLSKRLAYQACHDELTGLFNRRELESRLEAALAKARKYANQGFWLGYIDLDQFKIVNDTCGHLAGDQLLKQVADIVTQEVRASDMVARIGGDEFTVLLEHCPDYEARSIMERIRHKIQEHRFAWDGKSFTSSASIGMTPICKDGGSVYDVMSAADTACFVAKDEGRNRLHIRQGDDDASVHRAGEMEMVHRINLALERNRFVLYQQPICPLQKSEAGLHVEVLMRMLDEEGNIVPPMAYIPAAERYNKMIDIDRWVVKATFDAFEPYQNVPQLADSLISINLSGQSMCDDDFMVFVLELLDSERFNPRNFCFEITETCAMANLSRAVKFMTAVKARGCRFSLDDFGSGLSSFGYLKNLPVDFLKIDGCFVRDILDDPIDHVLVESICQVAHVMGLQTIGEYAESPEVVAKLKQIGVDYAQGYNIGRPAPFHDLLESLEVSEHIQALCG